jgi:hypothetical protein
MGRAQRGTTKTAQTASAVFSGAADWLTSNTTGEESILSLLSTANVPKIADFAAVDCYVKDVLVDGRIDFQPRASKEKEAIAVMAAFKDLNHKNLIVWHEKLKVETVADDSEEEGREEPPEGGDSEMSEELAVQ